MCSLVAHDKIQPANEDDGSSIGDQLMPKHSTTEALEALGATLNFIEENYDRRCVAYSTDMKDMFKKIFQTMIKGLTPKQKIQKHMT